VYVLEGKIRDELCEKVCQAYEAVSNNPALADDYKETYSYYPEKWFSPYIDRRRENGWSLYGLLGIEKGEKEKMFLQHQRNFRFFDAPVGLFFTIHKDLGTGSILDYGMFLQSVMISAQSHGLATCPQAAWNKFSKIIAPTIGAGEDEMLVCGMALGYADKSHKVNTFQTPRATVEEFTTWVK
jgi:nitroreductase